MSKTAFKGLLAFYLVVGLLWSGTLGVYIMNLKSISGDKEFYDFITSVTSAKLDKNDQLVLCLMGHRETRTGGNDQPATSFELTIPAIQLMDHPDEATKQGFSIRWENWLNVPRTSIKDACTSDSAAKDVPVIVMSGNEPSEFFDGLDDAQLAELTLPAGHRHAIFVAPVSSDSATFNFFREVAYVGQSSSNARKAYTLHIEPLRKNNSISLWRWLVAIAADTLMWPIQILMWMNYAKSH